VWEHRKFCVERKHAVVAGLVAQEVALCDKFHTYDARNFHCWNYRRWLVQLGGADKQAELAYSLRRINEGWNSLFLLVVSFLM
jgi:geranylgeranyl transferase type-2 subunit alpha